ncbi:MAG: sulfotransferase family protein [Acidobacteriota bacterium]
MGNRTISETSGLLSLENMQPASYEKNLSTQTLRICLWSGPRNISTALMYSFAQRTDTCALDEPLYAHYLNVTDAEHPGKQEVLAALENDGEKVVRNVILGEYDRPVVFMKQMAHHLTKLDWSFLKYTANILLIRDPAQVLISLAKKLAKISLRDTGLAIQAELLEKIEALGQPPLVLDGNELLLDPKGVLTQLCSKLGLAFQETMLNWQAGPKPIDGVWAKYWYHNVHSSSGFEPYRENTEMCPPNLLPLLAECLPYYERLRAFSIKAEDCKNIRSD